MIEDMLLQTPLKKVKCKKNAIECLHLVSMFECVRSSDVFFRFFSESKIEK